MPDFNVRSDAVNVEQIMEQIRARIREKRGVDYTEAQIRELASVKLEKFLDPRGVRSDLLEQFRRAQPPYAPPELPNFAFEDETLFESTRGPLRFIRRLLLPILKLFFNPNPLIKALNIQSKLNAAAAEREAKRDAARSAFDQLHYEVMHNLVLETTRLGIEVKNLNMRIESLASRLEFNERRARALESAVVYRPSDERESRREDNRRDDNRREDTRRQDARRSEQPARPQPPAPAAIPPAEPQADAAAVAESSAESANQSQPAIAEGPGQRSRRRRRRRGRRGGSSAAALMNGATQTQPGVDQAASAEQGIDEGDVEGEGESSVADTSTAGEPSETTAPDSRESRPELFEHAFGAQAHPAEPASSDPAHTPAAEPTSTSTEPESGSQEPPSNPPASEQ
jgi:hypothetical protein